MKESSQICHLSPLRKMEFPSEWYDDSSSTHFWFAWRFHAFRNQFMALKENCRSPWRVLDVGGGTGVLRQQIERQTAWSVDVAELNETALLHSTPGRGDNLYYDIQDLHPTRVGAYDVVTLFDVLEHVEDRQALLRACAVHLRPNGLLCVNVPAMMWMYGHYDRAAGHLIRYSASTLVAELKTAGFQLRDVRYWGLSLIPLVLLRGLMQRRESSEAETIRRGFHPPSRAFNRLMQGLMQIETTALKRPPGGTSVLALCSYVK